MLKSSALIAVFLMLVAPIATAQQLEDKTVMTIANQPVTAGEFVRVYKKNLNLVNNQEQRDLDNYLDLYVDYKLKVAEAYDRKLDTSKSFQSEYRQYKYKLAATYMVEGEVTEQLMQEAFERSKEQIRARHILIKSTIEDFPEDTLAAYNKAVDIRNQIVSGKLDFDAAAKQYSEDESVAENGGDLGWFSSFRMVYPFESAAYNTPQGEISDVIRTQFGYHIIKVTGRREVAPDVTVAHIMISPKTDDPSFDAEARINELYSNLQQGASFEELAKQYSDDKNTGKDGGKVRRFGPGQLNTESFEQQSFALENPGDISKPFQTNFGWHIVKLLERHMPATYEEIQPRLKQQVKRAQRQDYIDEKSREQLLAHYKVESPVVEVVPFFTEFLNDSITKKQWVYRDSLNPAMKKVLFTLGDKTFTYDDFARYVEKRQRVTKRYATTYAAAKTIYEDYEFLTIRDHFKNNLDKEDPVFAGIVREYKEGLLIFELMESTIWGKVRTDSVGLEGFYNDHLDQYRYAARVKGLIGATPSKSVANKLRKELKKDSSLDDLKQMFNSSEQTQVLFSEGTFEAGDRLLPEAYKMATGVSKVYNNNGQFTVIRAEELITPAQIPLDQIKGRVMGDYQTQLETTFMEGLKAKFTVDVDQQVLNEIKAQL